MVRVSLFVAAATFDSAVLLMALVPPARPFVNGDAGWMGVGIVGAVVSTLLWFGLRERKG